MKCPVCETSDLLITVREGVEIDYCPDCRGVWLDRGELDKIIDRTVAELGNPPLVRSERRDNDYDDHDDYDDDDEVYHKPKRDPRKKRKSFLSELFDFD